MSSVRWVRLENSFPSSSNFIVPELATLFVGLRIGALVDWDKRHNRCNERGVVAGRINCAGINRRHQKSTERMFSSAFLSFLA